ncbi:MAG: Ig-like domain-containing protein [Paludibacteraceae bacterium]|nr:Ig-like domain-containing protein [Paludibacteraceae bacterium]
MPSAYSQGVLTFEISDTLNAPIQNFKITIKQNNQTFKTYTTDTEGRVIDNSFPAGDYTYYIGYGDLTTGSFSVKNGEPTWINLDYRRVSIHFKDEKGNPSSGNSVTLYKKNPDGTRTKIGKRESGTDGKVLFVVPEGLYSYEASNGITDFVVSDKNINTDVSTSSKLITYPTKFRFVKEGEPIKVYAKDIAVSQFQNGTYVNFGLVLAHGTTVQNGYTLYSLTDNKISCPVGEFQYTVSTKDYGTITGTFNINSKTSQTNNIVDIVLPNDDDDDDDDDDDGDGDKDEYKDKDFHVHFNVVSCEDSTPLKDIICGYAETGKAIHNYKSTNDDGLLTYTVKGGIYDFSVRDENLDKVLIKKDTIISICLPITNLPNYRRVLFRFFHNGEQFHPQSIDHIYIGKYIKYSNFTTLTKYTDYYPIADTDGLNKYTDTLYLPEGKYSYRFDIEESFHKETYEKDFTIEKDTAVKYIDFDIQDQYTVDLYVLNADSTPVNGVYYYEIMKDGKSVTPTNYSKQSDKKGYKQFLTTGGSHTFSAAGTTHTLEIKNDTTLYFILGKTRNVFFKFLHDGEIINPDIMSMDILKEEELYFYLTSTKTNGNYVFDKPAPLEAGHYTSEYYFNDKIEGTSVSYKVNQIFEINPGESDTTIYFVVPVKRTVDIQIKDAKGSNVVGVYATIEKQTEKGGWTEVFEGLFHTQLMSDVDGIVHDQLVPGHYRIKILDIVREFDITDYDLKFSINSDVTLFNVVFKFLYSDDNTPVKNLPFTLLKGSSFYASLTSGTSGSAKTECESGTYSFNFNNGISHDETYAVYSDTTFVIYIDRPVPVKSIKLSGKDCIIYGESVEISATITPKNATLKDIEYSIDNFDLAKISTDGTLTAKESEESGYVTVTATAKDGSGVVGTLRVHIGESCDDEDPEDKDKDKDKDKDDDGGNKPKVEEYKDNIMIPTAFTPHEKDGANDDFMPGYSVIIYNRSGDVICDSNNGWDGTYKGVTADAGVYIYVLKLKDGRVKKGTIQLYRK